MPLIIPLLYISSGIALLAAIQGAILSLRNTERSTLLMFSLMSVLISCYQG